MKINDQEIITALYDGFVIKRKIWDKMFLFLGKDNNELIIQTAFISWNYNLNIKDIIADDWEILNRNV